MTATAEDSCGNYAVVAQSFTRSGQYFSAVTSQSSSARVNQGMVARLNQSVMDDYNRSDLDDVASLAQAVVQNIDLNAAIPGTLAVDPDGNGDGTSTRRPMSAVRAGLVGIAGMRPTRERAIR